MYKKISVTLAGGEQGEMACLANGATAIRYRQTFKEDLLTGISTLLEAIGEDSLVKAQREQRRKEQTKRPERFLLRFLLSSTDRRTL